MRAFKESKEAEKEGSQYFDKLGGALFTMISSFVSDCIALVFAGIAKM